MRVCVNWWGVLSVPTVPTRLFITFFQLSLLTILVILVRQSKDSILIIFLYKYNDKIKLVTNVVEYEYFRLSRNTL